MKTFYQLATALVIAVGLTACGTNSMFEAEMTDSSAGGDMLARSADKASIPEGCVSWFDGCNTCSVEDGEVGACTKMACKTPTSEAACRSFAPGFSADAVEGSAEAVTEEPAAPETMPETQREASAEVPANCKIWFDGCNSCVVMRGKLRGCTSKVCTTQQEPSCTKSN